MSTKAPAAGAVGSGAEDNSATKVVKAYSYIRMSTAEQLEGDSLRRQGKKTREYAERLGLELVEDYDDIGVSAYRGRNSEQGALGRFLEAVHTGDVPKGSHLVIESMDRLTRQSAMMAVSLMSEIIQAGITIVTLDNNISYSSETVSSSQATLFIAVGEMIRAHEESRRKSMMLADVWDEKRRGIRESLKTATARIPAWLTVNESSGSIVDIPARAAVVREVFDLACNGFGTYSIARLFNERDEPAWGAPKRTKIRPAGSTKVVPMWRESYIKKIISNRAVLGEFQSHRVGSDEAGRRIRIPVGDVVLGYYPRIIDDQLFREANLAMERRRISAKGRKGAVYSNIFSGLLHCIQCGSTMRFIDKGQPPKGGKYLRCSRSVTGGLCIKKAYRYDAVEATVLQFLENLDVHKVLGGEPLSRRIADLRLEKQNLEIDLKALDEKISNTFSTISSFGGTRSLTTGLGDLERSAASIRRSLERVGAELEEAMSTDPSSRQANLSKLLSGIGSSTEKETRVQARRALAGELHRLVSQMVIGPVANFAHEVMDADASWKETFQVGSQTYLERYLDQFGFEISIQYRNHVQQIISGVEKKHLKMKVGKRFNDLKRLAWYGV